MSRRTSKKRPPKNPKRRAPRRAPPRWSGCRTHLAVATLDLPERCWQGPDLQQAILYTLAVHRERRKASLHAVRVVQPGYRWMFTVRRPATAQRLAEEHAQDVIEWALRAFELPARPRLELDLLELPTAESQLMASFSFRGPGCLPAGGPRFG
ncbi:MAG TPA: hypothetical protein RMH85_13135 [Polyangiaceae bacterium LLY-WYZ-15_(1-7)]|nr:hypothetical protein [Myxococcales bacterium]MAT25709.1 hypothetical protein [Sandaracinus sp.]HJK99783.1 hypothetical protein [Polyangiaceae bacterium LLY-WYZ-15_(1-7)]MBJ71690.1 hypothetical protein [Sandaracinus sp.]HJL09444.1 hypothetical protein [Polyangiaceae bacterium LLY-WYZ-15_(1-7)]